MCTCEERVLGPWDNSHLCLSPVLQTTMQLRLLFYRPRPSYRLCWYGQSVHYLKTLCRQKKVTLSILCQQILNRSRICLPTLNLFMRLDFRKNIILTRRALGADVTSTTSSGSLQTEFYFVDSLCFSALQMWQLWLLSHRFCYWVRSENLVIYKNWTKWIHQEQSLIF